MLVVLLMLVMNQILLKSSPSSGQSTLFSGLYALTADIMNNTVSCDMTPYSPVVLQTFQDCGIVAGPVNAAAKQ
jgi:hypothetical protein